MSRSIAMFIHILQINRGYSLDFFKKSFKAVYPGAGALVGARKKTLEFVDESNY